MTRENMTYRGYEFGYEEESKMWEAMIEGELVKEATPGEMKDYIDRIIDIRESNEKLDVEDKKYEESSLGFVLGEVIMIGGETKIGKSILLQNILNNNVIDGRD